MSAILKARDSGITYAAIADAAGTSSQAVQEIARRHRKDVEPVPAQGAGIAAIAAPQQRGRIGS
ncbi:hypothetical protein GSY69_02405 [Brevibacterium sp. 5221]|uniref:Uncharacterized protein n=1 Tax=Brevibacterium rongguiense TaxID=2695267 RepID=A0A6N9H4U9_9MICO|nr:hypothetical protein [Brevibacterium rongguiense]